MRMDSLRMSIMTEETPVINLEYAGSMKIK